MTKADLDFYASMDPQLLHQMLGLGGLGEQYDQAQAFAQPQGKNWGTVGGNIGGGIGDIIRQIGGGIRMHDVGQQQTAGRNAYADAIRAYAQQHLGGGQSPSPTASAGTQDGVPLTPFTVPQSMANLGNTQDGVPLTPFKVPDAMAQLGGPPQQQQQPPAMAQAQQLPPSMSLGVADQMRNLPDWLKQMMSPGVRPL